MKTEAEIEKAMRFHAAKLLKARDCPCETCRAELVPTQVVADVLAWVLGRPIELGRPAVAGLPSTFAAHLIDLYDRQGLAKLLHDPRMAEILPAAGESS